MDTSLLQHQCIINIPQDFNNSRVICITVLPFFEYRSYNGRSDRYIRAITTKGISLHALQMEFPPNADDFSSVDHLIIVCCHSIWLGGPTNGQEEAEW